MSRIAAMKISFQMSLLGLLLIALDSTSIYAQDPLKAVGHYNWVFSDREGRPSKCDCDYQEERIELAADGTFLYLEQRGRMDAKQEWEKGTWSMRNDSLVDLITTHQKGRMYPLIVKETDLDTWKAASNHRTFIFERGRLYNWWRDKIYD
jgi:hypothetical protein